MAATGTTTLITMMTMAAVTTKGIMTTTVGRGAAVVVLKKEPTAAPLENLQYWQVHTVRLTSIYYRVSGYQNFHFAPTETIDGRVKKIRCPICGMV